MVSWSKSVINAMTFLVDLPSLPPLTKYLNFMLRFYVNKLNVCKYNRI